MIHCSVLKRKREKLQLDALLTWKTLDAERSLWFVLFFLHLPRHCDFFLMGAWTMGAFRACASPCFEVKHSDIFSESPTKG